MKNYYEILEIFNSATIDEIKKAYRLKAIKYHPDKHFGDSYFTEKFIEIKEAYDILSDSSKRSEYDLKYKQIYSFEIAKTHENLNEDRKAKHEKEEQFTYDPYRPFYSYKDRLITETPQFIPKINHWGEPLPENLDFFVLPKKIGKIISGFTTLKIDEKSPAGFLNKMFNNFKHTCSYMGVNGFAIYNISGNRKNIVKSIEINFNEVTDLLFIRQQRRLNFNYQDTIYGFEWSKDGKIIADFNGTYYDKNDNPERIKSIEYWSNIWAERYWTVYLLDNMELTLEKKGFIEFRIINKNDLIPFIRLGVGYITFLDKKESITYKFNEIKRVYRKGTNLFVEHNNYEKSFLFFKKGCKNGVPLLELCNRQFFFKAMELLLGRKFS